MNLVVMAAMMLAMVFVVHRKGHHKPTVAPAAIAQEGPGCEGRSGCCLPPTPGQSVEPTQTASTTIQASE